MFTHYRPFRERKKGFIRPLLCLISAALMGIVIHPSAFATTYTITDGPRVYTYTGLFADPGKALEGAGLELWEADSYTAETQGSTGQISINRAQRITIRYHGKTELVASKGETVGALLARLHLTVDPADVLTPSPDTRTYSGMTVSVDSVTQQTQTYTTQVPHDTLLCNSAQLPAGMREVLIPGKDGTLLRQAKVTYTNKEESLREILREELLNPPVTEILAVGTGQHISAPNPRDLPIIGENTITLPTGEVLTYTKTDLVRATAYTHTDEGCDMTTATGSKVRRGTVAVDPRFIPYGTRMFIMAVDGSYVYGVAEAEDCGGDIKGDRMDLYMPTLEECLDFGRRRCILYFLG